MPINQKLDKSRYPDNIAVKTSTNKTFSEVRNPLSRVTETTQGIKAYASHPGGLITFVDQRPPPPMSRLAKIRKESTSHQLSTGQSETIIPSDRTTDVKKDNHKFDFTTRKSDGGKADTSNSSGLRKGALSRRQLTQRQLLGVPLDTQEEEDPLKGYFQNLEEMLKRVSSGRHTRECSEDLVKYASMTNEPFSVENAKKNPWIVDLTGEETEPQEKSCCTIV